MWRKTETDRIKMAPTGWRLNGLRKKYTQRRRPAGSAASRWTSGCDIRTRCPLASITLYRLQKVGTRVTWKTCSWRTCAVTGKKRTIFFGRKLRRKIRSYRTECCRSQGIGRRIGRNRVGGIPLPTPAAELPAVTTNISR